MTAGKTELKDGCTEEWMDACRNGRMCGGINGYMKNQRGGVDECIKEWMDGGTNEFCLEKWTGA